MIFVISFLSSFMNQLGKAVQNSKNKSTDLIKNSDETLLSYQTDLNVNTIFK